MSTKQNWETVIGLEVHAELSTRTKIFCGCPTEFGGAPNTQTCPVCAGMPGSLPRLNLQVVERAIRAGLALSCKIVSDCKFDRKNYFYPDLPKAYQISQLYSPICQDGHLEIQADGQSKLIGIREIHMEEDAGKLVHNPVSGTTQMDFNRCGVPLIEIVTQPDFRSSQEVIFFLEKLREILLYLDVCDCKMQEGSLRADVNLSIRPIGGDFGVRTEMKNLNSFKAIQRAIDYEQARQIDVLEGGGSIFQETRRWDDDKGISYGMRSKENPQDYRYFPEPDLLPLRIDAEWIETVKKNLPELAHEKRERYVRDYGLPATQVSVLTCHKNISDLFEIITAQTQQPQETASLITGQIMRLLNQTNTLPEALDLDEKKFSTLVRLVVEGKINRNAYKETVEAVYLHHVKPMEYIEENQLMMITDRLSVNNAIYSVLSENTQAVEDYRKGIGKALGFLMGQAMKRLGGIGDPNLVMKLLKEELEK